MEERGVQHKGQTALVTGAAGFIGFSLVSRLLEDGVFARVIGVDCVNDYYDVRLKERRLGRLAELAVGARTAWHFVRGDMAESGVLASVFERFMPSVVVHLAAQAGVRYSVSHPEAYVHSNLAGFVSVLEACRRHEVRHLVYASSSSVYGHGSHVPYSESDDTDSPVSLYAATKKSNELMARSYSSLFGLATTGVRIFTAYGPWGRPDMAYFSFAEKMRLGEPLPLYNYGKCLRDFTYVGDVVEGFMRLLDVTPREGVPAAVYNLGNSSPVQLMDFVQCLRDSLIEAGAVPSSYDLGAHLVLVPPQAGDVAMTCADVTRLEAATGFRPMTPLREGLRRFAQWYGAYIRGREGEA